MADPFSDPPPDKKDSAAIGLNSNGDIFQLHFKPSSDGIHELNYQIASHSQFFLRAGLLQRLQTAIPRSISTAGLSSFLTAKKFDDILKLLLPFQQHVFEIQGRFEEIRRQRHIFDQNHFGHVSQINSLLNSLYLDLRQLFQTFRDQLDSHFVY